VSSLTILPSFFGQAVYRRGHFYFGQTGHYHFGITPTIFDIQVGIMTRVGLAFSEKPAL